MRDLEDITLPVSSNDSYEPLFLHLLKFRSSKVRLKHIIMRKYRIRLGKYMQLS